MRRSRETTEISENKKKQRTETGSDEGKKKREEKEKTRYYIEKLRARRSEGTKNEKQMDLFKGVKLPEGCAVYLSDLPKDVSFDRFGSDVLTELMRVTFSKPNPTTNTTINNHHHHNSSAPSSHSETAQTHH